MKFFDWRKKKSRAAEHFIAQEGKISDNLLDNSYKKRWVEEVWLPKDEKRVIQPLKEFLGISLSSRRLKLFIYIVFLFSFIILSRLFYLQLWHGSHYFQLAEDNRLRIKPILAERGLIYDCNQIPLIANLPTFNLVLTPRDLSERSDQLEEILQRIAPLGNESLENLKQKINLWKKSSFQSINLIENLNHQEALKLVVESAEWPGVSLEQSFKRFYPFSPSVLTSSTFSLDYPESKNKIQSLSHILGYVSKLSKEDLANHPQYLMSDFIGKSGLEKSYEEKLRGVYGKEFIEVDALGKEKNVVKIEPPQPGDDLILSINLNYQKKLEEILIRNLQTQGKKRAAAIALNPQNGEILALVNLPAFNNNLFTSGVSETDYQKLLVDPDAPLFSRAWSGTYPSGSTIKPVVAAGALAEKIISEETTFLSTGGIQIGSWFFPDWKAGGHGATNVTKALAESVNTFFYLIGGGYKNFSGLGLTKLSFYFKKFGLGKILGIDLPNEAAGFIPSFEWKEKIKGESWYIGDTYNLSIGQGDLLVTPLQIAALTSAVANGGTLFQPHLARTFVKHLKEKNENNEEIQPLILEKNIVSDQYLKIVRQGMRQAVTEGSARSLSDLSIKVAGKTGTAQWSKKAANHAWFTSFAPYDNPKIVLTILIEEGGEGSISAIPVAKEFYKWWAGLTMPNP